MGNPLLGISELGQSVWYDNISRDLLRSGGLEKMIEEDRVTGVTSNPSIFQQAIGGQKTYDSDLHELVDQGKDVYGIYEGLAVSDIREAADLLAPVYEKTSGADGFVSLEVAPDLAYDREATLSEVRSLWELVGRDNLMIKVPATLPGIEAVEVLISEGININATLIFSLEQYRSTATAYINGMTRWVDSGGDPGRVASVASFFVSRLDTMVDERLKEVANPAWKRTASELSGKAAIANAKLAYAIFKDLCNGTPFTELKSKGARPQRVLWASTSTKNPDYPDTYYVDALIGPETVNTLPTATINVFRDHGEAAARLEVGLDEAREVFTKLAEVGINMDEVTDQLLDNGVRSFAESFEKLLEGIGTKRTRLLRGWGHRSASLGDLQKDVDGTLAAFDKEKLTESFWAQDSSIWTDDPEIGGEVGQRLGWLTVVETMQGETARLRDFVEEIKSLGYSRAVLVGMGGSSLAPAVFQSCFGTAEGFLNLNVLDTTDPTSILELDRQLDLEKTLFIVSSKSGSTIEVLSLYKYFRRRMDEAVGDEAGKHFIAITDPGTPLGKLASDEGFRKVFLNPPDIGGRFSALSYFGLVPAALIGVDLDRMLMRAAQAAEAAGLEVPALENPGLWLGVILGQASLSGKDKVTIIASPGIATFGLWLEQLLAESTGKRGKGVVPIDREPIGTPDVCGDDRIFIYLRIDEEGAYDAEVSALEKSGHKVISLRLHTPYDLGREIFRWEFATATAGKILGVNPFDQPNVQAAKDLTSDLLDDYVKKGTLPDEEMLEIDDPTLSSSLREFLGLVNTGDYVAFNAFVHPSNAAVATLQEMRGTVRDKFKVATTLGFGPRYLHSTGQIHKGGAANGLFLLITTDNAEDAAIPGEAYSFEVLNSAQSLGDYQALKKAERRVLRIHLKSESHLDKLLDALKSL